MQRFQKKTECEKRLARKKFTHATHCHQYYGPNKASTPFTGDTVIENSWRLGAVYGAEQVERSYGGGAS